MIREKLLRPPQSRSHPRAPKGGRTDSSPSETTQTWENSGTHRDCARRHLYDLSIQSEFFVLLERQLRQRPTEVSARVFHPRRPKCKFDKTKTLMKRGSSSSRPWPSTFTLCTTISRRSTFFSRWWRKIEKFFWRDPHETLRTRPQVSPSLCCGVANLPV